MGKNCVLVINLMVRDYFRGTTELNQAKMTVAETFYPSKLGSSYCKSYTPKKWLSSEISDPKTWHAYPVCKHGKYPPPGRIFEIHF